LNENAFRKIDPTITRQHSKKEKGIPKIKTADDIHECGSREKFLSLWAHEKNRNLHFWWAFEHTMYIFIFSVVNAMKKAILHLGVLLSAVALGSFFIPTSASAWTETEGCTPGYWKNHLDNAKLYGREWTLRNAAAEVTGMNVDQLSFIPADIKLVDAATGKASGPTEQFYRHLAAGILNIWSGQVDYLDPQTTLTQILLSAAANPASIEDEKNLLDKANNLGCPLN
jgi:hypothetical protein